MRVEMDSGGSSCVIRRALGGEGHLGLWAADVGIYPPIRST